MERLGSGGPRRGGVRRHRDAGLSRGLEVLAVLLVVVLALTGLLAADLPRQLSCAAEDQVGAVLADERAADPECDDRVKAIASGDLGPDGDAVGASGGGLGGEPEDPSAAEEPADDPVDRAPVDQSPADTDPAADDVDPVTDDVATDGSPTDNTATDDAGSGQAPEEGDDEEGDDGAAAVVPPLPVAGVVGGAAGGVAGAAGGGAGAAAAGGAAAGADALTPDADPDAPEASDPSDEPEEKPEDEPEEEPEAEDPVVEIVTTGYWECPDDARTAWGGSCSFIEDEVSGAEVAASPCDEGATWDAERRVCTAAPTPDTYTECRARGQIDPNTGVAGDPSCTERRWPSSVAAGGNPCPVGWRRETTFATEVDPSMWDDTETDTDTETHEDGDDEGSEWVTDDEGTATLELDPEESSDDGWTPARDDGDETDDDLTDDSWTPARTDLDDVRCSEPEPEPVERCESDSNNGFEDFVDGFAGALGLGGEDECWLEPGPLPPIDRPQDVIDPPPAGYQVNCPGAVSASLFASSTVRPMDPLAAAVSREVDVDAITPRPHWRTDADTLWRVDTRSPIATDSPGDDGAIFETGFAPKAPTMTDLWEFVEDGKEGAFVSTTRGRNIVPQFQKLISMHQGNVYTIDAPGGINVNDTLGNDHLYDWQHEIAFPGGIQSRYIKEVVRYPPLKDEVEVEPAYQMTNPCFDP